MSVDINDYRDFDLAQKYDRIPEKRFTVLYSGNMGLAQGLESVIKAADILQKYPIDFCFVGNGIKRNTIFVIIPRNRNK